MGGNTNKDLKIIVCNAKSIQRRKNEQYSSHSDIKKIYIAVFHYVYGACDNVLSDILIKKIVQLRMPDKMNNIRKLVHLRKIHFFNIK